MSVLPRLAACVGPNALSGANTAAEQGKNANIGETRPRVKKALLAAKTVAYSSGASGVYVQRLFERLGIAAEMKATSKQAPPGMRVAQYLANGDADLGFQQISELVHETGIDFLGPLPAEIQNVTTYSSGITTGSNAAEPARALQAFLSAPAGAAVIRKNGMEPSHP